MPWVEVVILADLREGEGHKICHGGHVAAVFLAEGDV